MKWLAFGIGVLSVGAQLTPTKIDEFKSWKRLTEKPAMLSPQLSALCATPIVNSSPHAASFIHVYVNSLGEEAARKAATFADNPSKQRSVVFPAGSVLVKTKFQGTTDRQGNAKFDPSKGYEISLMTVMIKLGKGSSPKTGDWKFKVMDGSGRKELPVKEKQCYSCHKDGGADSAFLQYRDRF